MATIAEHQMESTLRPSTCSVEVESLTTTGSDGISADEWHVTDDTDLQFWRHQAEERESLIKKYEAEVTELRQKVVEQSFQLDAAEKAEKKAKAQCDIFEHQAQRQEGLRKLVQNALDIAQEKAEKEEDFRTKWQDKAEAEKELRLQYQQRTTEAENNQETWRVKADHRSQLFEEESLLRQKADEELNELKSKVEQEKNGREKAEQQAQHWKKKFEGEERLRKGLEKLQETSGRLGETRKDQAPSEVAEEEAHVQQAEARAGGVPAKEIQDEAALALAHRWSCVGLRRYYVTYKFSGIYAARRSSYTELCSSDLRFEGMDDPLLSYPFKLLLCPGGDEKHKGAVGLFWAPLPGPSDEPLTWPVPHDKVKIALRILPDLSSGGGKKDRKPKESVLDGATSKGFREFLAEQSPPEKGNRIARGCPSLLKKAEFEEGGWTTGPDADEMVVQAELILK